MPDLKGKVAIITGASSGIGEATALRFASLGCWLSLTARNRQALEKVAKECCARGIPCDKVLVVPGDISSGNDVATVVETTAKYFGKIDILVNNAGMVILGTLESTPVEDFECIWKTNFRGPLCMIKNAVPYLRQTKGCIVNVSSVGSTAVVMDAVPYCTAKAALDHLTRYAALENAPFGVRVNAVNPAVIKTTFLMQPGLTEDKYFEFLEQTMAPIHALGRLGTPDEVARCIAFLASDDASFVTGISMPVDGGMLLMSSASSVTQWEDKQTALGRGTAL